MMDNSTQGDFILAPGEVTVRCPYNFSHEITNMKLIIHLQKCQKNYHKECLAAGKKPEYGTCRFNSTHRPYLPELQIHEQRCPDAAKIVPVIQHINSADFKKEQSRQRPQVPQPVEISGLVTIPEQQKVNNWGADAEDWEADSRDYQPAYVPALKLEKDIILYTPRGLSKSERKKFRLEQRQKASAQEAAAASAAKAEEEKVLKSLENLKLEKAPAVAEPPKPVKPTPAVGVGAWGKKPPPPEPLPPSLGATSANFVQAKEDDDDYCGDDPFG